MRWVAKIPHEIDVHTALNSLIQIRNEGRLVDIRKNDLEIINLIETKQVRLENIKIHIHLLLGLQEVEETGI